LRHIILRYNQYFISLVSQGTLCNRIHEVNHRLARWILMCADGTGSEEIDITHEYLATMLGTHRPSVTLAMTDLEGRHAVTAGRGRIRIVDRAKLEEVASPCYRVIRDEWERLL